MKNRFTAIVLFLLLISFRTLHGQTADCQKKCQEQKTQCSNRCMVMAADNTGCEERCVKESARCLGTCQSVKPDGSDAADDDAEYEDNDTDDADEDFDKDDDLDNDDDFKDMED
ncbi:MAG TPA: hypothetical protein PLM53_06110 [Spirochaetota bacterium]|nr:hypothetical protein [Spirochaetota bacterium]HPC39669.1 hypothetical protein [Spirochaetota bacterium]HPL19240.1 hypothetical protein [Spirochaetota bacterium]HQF07396.1 hypothetical protein [Spirochaetota bacterium]HQH96656.1 hypothetical protein [Spirochaetota bacterium]